MSQRAPLLFNPSRASFEELEKTFVGRWPQMEALERDLLADGAGPSTRHWLLIGPRGSGKSHFTELLSRRLRQNHGWGVARLPEEHYQVASVAELLEQIIIRLEGLKASPFAQERDPRKVEELAIDRLRSWRQKHGKPCLVVLENLGQFLDRKLTARRDQSRLREVLMQEPPFILLATATSYVEATVEHSAPFYDFFQINTLEELSRKEVIGLVQARAQWDQDENLLGKMEQVRLRIEAIFHFSGGNPRLVLALYGVLRHGVTEDLHTQLLELLDEVTPYYQARLNDVSPQMVRILTEMALAEGPLTPTEVGRRTRLTTPQVTANITRLVNERFVCPGGRPEDQRSRYYELTDRLFRIWMQMREGESIRQRLHFLTEFFQHWYGRNPEELNRDTARVAQTFLGSDSQRGPVAEELEEWLSELHIGSGVMEETFRTHMPRLARVPSLRPHVLECYRRLRERGILAEDIPPYSTALTVQEAPSTQRALSALHPEMREAVVLLLGLASGEAVNSKQQSTA
ncbi:MAG TPA: AAA family ATPase [Archangium sp.]|uniref:AAA family ATPase n=1 Tax=Archangium sp. TaxID=1872627 RepID=UPI002E37D348|nr:AAA family ATPase [Archangium sp.]HEX5752500.1 AAA family ATPase [Archangium sp.]